ncbi:MAG: hypothetical protein DHS20C04_32480 [Hyphococcus sp.]|nr:MAG: hypothetical protein DHS20C04_32480 [Marinicaulis sp.]
MMDLAESKFLPGTSVSGSYFQIERALIPEFLLEFYESFLFYESDYTATVKKTESPQ